MISMVWKLHLEWTFIQNTTPFCQKSWYLTRVESSQSSSWGREMFPALLTQGNPGHSQRARSNLVMPTSFVEVKTAGIFCSTPESTTCTPSSHFSPHHVGLGQKVTESLCGQCKGPPQQSPEPGCCTSVPVAQAAYNHTEQESGKHKTIIKSNTIQK